MGAYFCGSFFPFYELAGKSFVTFFFKRTQLHFSIALNIMRPMDLITNTTYSYHPPCGREVQFCTVNILFRTKNNSTLNTVNRLWIYLKCSV